MLRIISWTFYHGRESGNKELGCEVWKKHPYFCCFKVQTVCSSTRNAYANLFAEALMKNQTVLCTPFLD